MKRVLVGVKQGHSTHNKPPQKRSARLPCHVGAKIQTPSTTLGICGPSLVGGFCTTVLQNPQCKTSPQNRPLHAEGQRGLTPPSNRHKCTDLPALATPRPCTYGSCTYVIQCTHKRTKRCLQFILRAVTYHSSLPFLNFLHLSLNSLKRTISVAERGAVR